MKRKFVFLSVTILSIFSLTTMGNAQDTHKKLSLKLSVGYGNTALGDMDDLVNGLNSQLADLAAMFGLADPDDIENVNWGPEFECEFVFTLSKNFGVGFGVGYMERKKDSYVEMKLEPLFSGSFSWDPKYQAIPVNLNGYYFFPINSKMKVYLKAGIAYYFTKLTFKKRTEFELPGVSNEWDQEDIKAKDNGFGLHGGLGVEFKITKGISVCAEGMGRYASFKNWEAESTYTDSLGNALSQSGTFWYVEEFLLDTGKYYPSLTLSEQKPLDPDFRNVRKLENDFSGFSFRIGIKIGFGK